MKLWVKKCDTGDTFRWSDFIDVGALEGVVDSIPETIVSGGYVLQDSEAGLALHCLDGSNASPTRVDFTADRLWHRVTTTRRNEGLAKAVGLDKTRDTLTVLDATAGMGTDAYLLAAKGCQVTMLEKHPVMAALLADGLARGRQAGGGEWSAALGRLQLVYKDAHTYLKELASDQLPPDQLPDVIYLDPMFPPRQKSARVKKDMALMQGLLPPNDDVDALLALALTKARKRVVLKRPGKSEKRAAKGARAPDFQVPGKSCHFQVFLVAR